LCSVAAGVWKARPLLTPLILVKSFETSGRDLPIEEMRPHRLSNAQIWNTLHLATFALGPIASESGAA